MIAAFIFSGFSGHANSYKDSEAGHRCKLCLEGAGVACLSRNLLFAKIIQAGPTAKFIWGLCPNGLFSGENSARAAYGSPSSDIPPLGAPALGIPVSFDVPLTLASGTTTLSQPPPGISPPALLSASSLDIPVSSDGSHALPSSPGSLPSSPPDRPFARYIRASPSQARLSSGIRLAVRCPVFPAYINYVLLPLPGYAPPRRHRRFLRKAGDFGMKMRNTSLFGK